MSDEVRLSSQNLEVMAEDCAGISADLELARSKLVENSSVDLPGFQAGTAVRDITSRWARKLQNAESQWDGHAEATRLTARNVDATDEANAWHIPGWPSWFTN